MSKKKTQSKIQWVADLYVMTGDMIEPWDFKWEGELTPAALNAVMEDIEADYDDDFEGETFQVFKQIGTLEKLKPTVFPIRYTKI